MLLPSRSHFPFFAVRRAKLPVCYPWIPLFLPTKKIEICVRSKPDAVNLSRQASQIVALGADELQLANPLNVLC